MDITAKFYKHIGINESDLKIDDCYKKLAVLDGNSEKVNFVCKELKKHNFSPEFIKNGKDDSAAVKCKENGNKLFGVGNYTKALKEYTRTMAMAKNEVLAIAYANRSACLFKLNRFQDCINDITRALASNYPDNLKPKLITRKKQASKLQKPVEKYYEEIPTIADAQKNSMIQCASNCVKIEVNEEFGRHIVATRNIKIGEILSVEKPFVSVLTDHKLIHCHHCMELCYNPIPCENCSIALFCNDDCKKEAFKNYHKYECPVITSLVTLGFSENLFLAGLKIAILCKHEYNQLNSFYFDQTEYYRSDRYKEIHNLNSEAQKSCVQNLFSDALLTTLTFQLLQTNTDFFDSPTSEDMFKEVMLHQLQTVRLYGGNISEYVSDGFCYDNQYFAGGLYSFFSLFNHSCTFNVHRAFHGSTMVLRAINTIKKGEQCFVNYGPHYSADPKPVRQEKLRKRFYFECKCKACNGNWKHQVVDLAEVLGMNLMEWFTTEKKFRTADINVMKQYLPYIVSQLKQCEKFEPKGHALTLKKLMGACYDTFGNKNRL